MNKALRNTIYTVIVVAAVAILIGYFIFGIGKRKVITQAAPTTPQLVYAVTAPSQKESDGFYHTQFSVSIYLPQKPSQEDIDEANSFHFSTSFTGCKILTENAAGSTTPENLSVDCVSHQPITDTGALFNLSE